MYNGHEIALTEEQLHDIIEEKSVKYVLNPESEYEALQDGDKQALKHLIKAAQALDTVFLKQDCSYNLPQKEALEAAAANNDAIAQKALVLFNVFNGIEGQDGLSKEPVRIFKDLKLQKGKNVYPEDLSAKELINVLKKNPEKIPALLSNDTIVKRENDDLIGVPYFIAFREEYQTAAKELLLAAQHTTHKDLAKYLRYQAQALVSCDPEYSYKADAIWANLHDAPLEFTIGRESYEDTLTGAATEDKELLEIIHKNESTVKSKDFIGVRVGIVDIKASKELADYKNHLKNMGGYMPLSDQYKQSIDMDDKEELKQTLCDVDLVYLSGDYRACRPGITLAQNLPNDDKLSVQLKAGNRNVFHKQVRRTEDPERRQKMLDSLVDKSFHGLFEREADHLFTIGHELTHSLGPMSTKTGKDKKVSLGDGYGDIIEEAKADLGSLVTLDYFRKAGKYDEETINKIIVTWAVDQMPISEPTLNQAHRVREVMQFNYFVEKGAIEMPQNGKLSVKLEKMIPTAQEMLKEVIEIQLEGNANKAKEYVDKYRVWNDTLEYISQEKKKLKPKPYKIVEHILAKKILND